ncbi:hypothetical protein HET69_28680 [Streptomyces sp. CJ_13]|uniref:hypothetical protein n=1 Tax=Streptomyces sp. CJ_13 TaxID=2724943 RepID=UPI001BDD681E|nr:hypothetical protein [Streptomyces sp. CJ_13]MBT1187854.1 hypothetical protein [Streptomyces sp. CJ_13]
MNAFAHAEIHASTHAARNAELTAEAAAWRLARGAATPTTPAPPARPVLAALRNRLGEALVSAGIRLMRPAHSGVHRPA